MHAIQAIRSLQMPDHAKNIPPKIRLINWMIGKRCNYDCTYCSSHQHDAVSPWLDLDLALEFVHRMHQRSQQSGTKLSYSFTGGEPFLDPGFLPLLKAVHDLDTTEKILATTNGSLPLHMYETASQQLDNLSFSLHLERSVQELDVTIDKISQVTGCFINVVLMFLPGRLQQIKLLQKQLDCAGIANVVRAVRHNVDPIEYRPTMADTTSRKQQRLLPIAVQVEHSGQRQNIADQHRYLHGVNFYSPQEQEFLQQCNQLVSWNNCGVWTKDDYQEINTDLLISRDLNQFQGWRCWAGVDSIYIDSTGHVYRGMCQNGGPMGTLSTIDDFAAHDTICERYFCNCTVDIATRKCLPQALHHVQP